jgi:general secretion pathway protein M
MTEWKRALGAFGDRHIQPLKLKWDQLNQRERRLLALLGGILGLYIFQLLVQATLVSPYQRYRDEEHSLRSDILQAITLSREIRQSQQIIQERSRTLAEDHAGFSLISYLEQEADRTHIRSAITQMTPRSLPPDGNYHTTLVSLRIEKVDLPHILLFLARLERSRHLIRITHVTIERRFDKHRLLDVRIDVQSIQPT